MPDYTLPNNYKTQLSDSLELSRIVHGHWRLADWNLTVREILRLTEQCIDLRITSFDHADIYGDYRCESLFGSALRLNKEIRKKIQIITKCGIKLPSQKYPHRKVKTYDYSYQHIILSVENSLKNFGTDYIDLFLLHRPAPFFDPYGLAEAFNMLKKQGKVLNFGVSNFSPQQFEMLNSITDNKLVTNQVEISPFCLEHFNNGNIDFFLTHGIKPMAWSPLAGGRIFNPGDEREKSIVQTLREIATELDLESIEQVAYKWLLMHPAGIIPITGSVNIQRIEVAVDAIHTKMSIEQWYKIYIASTGYELP